MDYHQLNTYYLQQCCNTLHRCTHLHGILNITVHQPPGYKIEMSLTYNKNTHTHTLIKHPQELLQQSLKINTTCTTAMSKKFKIMLSLKKRKKKEKKSLQMQVLWHTMRERGRLSLKPPAVLMCPRLRGQMNMGRLFVIIGYMENEVCLKSSSKHTHTKKSNSPIGSLSVQVSRLAGVAMSVVYLVRRQMDSGNKPSTRCPSRCTLWQFPSALFLQLKTSTSNFL